MKKNYKKPLSIVLVLAMLLSLCSLGATAATDNTESPDTTENYIDIEDTPDNIQAIFENNTSDYPDTENMQIVESDDLYEITTEKSDGTGTVSSFATPIKYVDDDGETQFIDTSMVSTGLINSLFSSYAYKNAANEFTVEYPKQANKGINMNDQFTLAVYNPDNQKYESATVTDSSNGDDILTYPEAFGDNTYVEYQNTSNGIKENIILESNVGKNTFDYIFKSDLYDLVLTDDSSMVYVVDKDNHDNIIYTFSDLYVYDSYNTTEEYTSGNTDALDTSYKHYTEDCYYSVTPLEDGSYIVTAVISEAFLNNPNTIYPVTIDPSVEYDNSESNLNDTYATNYTATDDTAVTRAGYTFLRIGKSGTVKYRSYIQFNSSPTVPFGAKITGATMRLILRTGQTTFQNASVKQIYEDWGQHVNKIDDVDSYSDTLYTSGANYESTEGYYYYLFNITDTVACWYNNANSVNYGVMLQYADESIADYNSVYSGNSGTSYNPYMIVNYETYSAASGITSGASYYIQNVGSGKYLNVNCAYTDDGTDICQYDYTGNYNQKWYVNYQGNGIYEIQAAYCSSLLTMKGFSADSLAETILYHDTDNDGTNHSTSQHFYIRKNSDGTYAMLSQTSNYTMALDDYGGGLDNNIIIKQSASNSSDFQKWKFVKTIPILTSANQQYYLNQLANLDNQLAINEAKAFFEANTLYCQQTGDTPINIYCSGYELSGAYARGGGAASVYYTFNRSGNAAIQVTLVFGLNTSVFASASVFRSISNAPNISYLNGYGGVVGGSGGPTVSGVSLGFGYEYGWTIPNYYYIKNYSVSAGISTGLVEGHMYTSYTWTLAYFTAW